jgi:transcriptional regulator with XRE-family HTH domain
MGLEATAIRLRAARMAARMSQKNLALACDVSNTVLNNAEMGLTSPNHKVMKYLYRAHRIDFNFLLNGDFAQLPGDVQSAIFESLEVATSEWDQKERSGRDPAQPKLASKPKPPISSAA